jgi:hypothetical protein
MVIFIQRKLTAILPNQEKPLNFSGSGITACIDYLAYEIICYQS